MAISLSAPSAARLRLSELVDIVGFAEMANVKPLSIHSYRKAAAVAQRRLEQAVEDHGSKSPEALRARGALARAQENLVPDPIAYIGNVPVWTRRQVADWMSTRPGQGTRSDLTKPK